MKYTQIKYRNSCDLGGSIFQAPESGFWYVIYLDVDIGKAIFEKLEEGREDGERNFIKDLQKQTKQYKFTTVVPEYQYDALCVVQMHDTIRITNKLDEESVVHDFTVTLDGWSDYGDYATVTVQFSVRYDLTTGCCNNETIVYEKCLSCLNFTVSGWASFTSAIYTNPSSLDRTYYLFGTPDPVTGEISTFYLYQYRYKSGWILSERSFVGLLCFAQGGINYRFYQDENGLWHICQVIRSITSPAPGSVNVKGWILPNTWARLYISTDGINYTPTGSITQADTMETAGITVTGLSSGMKYFKFYMYNNNCNYGYSNVRTITI